MEMAHATLGKAMHTVSPRLRRATLSWNKRLTEQGNHAGNTLDGAVGVIHRKLDRSHMNESGLLADIRETNHREGIPVSRDSVSLRRSGLGEKGSQRVTSV